MATEKQKRVAELIVENSTLDEPLNGGQIVENSGYGESMKLYPKRILESEGVLQELEVLGFTTNNAKTVVSEILLNGDNDPSARLKAADMVFKVQGDYAPTTNVNLNLNNESTPEILSKSESFDTWFKQHLSKT